MKSLLGRLLRSFPNSLQRENLFTEVVAHLFETRPQLCLAWLGEAELINPLGAAGIIREYPNIATQKWFAPLANHKKASQVDLFIRIHRMLEEDFGEGEAASDVVLIESKINSREEDGQLRRYAEHLNRMPNVGKKKLVYITRAYDPKESEEIRSGLGESIDFEQLRWHDFYRFLAALDEKEKDALVREVMAFMEEEGMARIGRFSIWDLMALSGIQRALEIIDETLDEEIRGELESLAGQPVKRKFEGRDFVQQVRDDDGYWIYADITQDQGFGCYAGYQMGNPDGSPRAEVGLWADPNVLGKEVALASVKRISNRDGWQRTDLDESELQRY